MNLSSNSTASRRVVSSFAAAAALSFAQAASAGVVPGDTFTFDIAAFNSSQTVGYVLGSSLSTTFGTTQTFTSAGYNGQSYTITSYEVVGANTTTDYFKVTTPTNFLSSTSVDGTKMSSVQLDIGDSNSGVSFGNVADPVNLTTAISADTSTGNILYTTANTSFTLTPTVILAPNGLSFAAAEGVSYGSNAISTLAVHEFDLAVTYANPVSVVPETSNWALLLAGLGGMSVVARRSRTS